tara:strand:+ start:1119 stop:1298 length:180 start_codon:yes stop_codon:yes gene_type:complete
LANNTYTNVKNIEITIIISPNNIPKEIELLKTKIAKISGAKAKINMNEKYKTKTVRLSP